MLTGEIETYIEQLSISVPEKDTLKKYYQKIWGLVASGEIKLELDLHFIRDGQKYVVDFKSGFGSNEKGNTNRLLLVASVYQNLEDNYNCLIFVRSDENNHYFQTLKRSGIWHAHNGSEAYKQMELYSGFPLKQWIDANIDWKNDFAPDVYSYFKRHELDQYLVW